MGLERSTGYEQSEIKSTANGARGWKYILQKHCLQVGSLVVEIPRLGHHPSLPRGTGDEFQCGYRCRHI